MEREREEGHIGREMKERAVRFGRAWSERGRKDIEGGK